MITLKTLHRATAQQVFDQSVIHLLTQNKKALSLGDTGQCSYLTDDGLKCGAGCFIGKDEYKPEFEGEGWSSLLNKKLVPDAHAYLIGEIQKVHDAISYRCANWPGALLFLASRFNLDPSSVHRMQAKLKLAKLTKANTIRHIPTNKAYRVNGKLQTSKRHPLQFTLPMKQAPYSINESNLDKWEIL